jgi:hypothetical protein
MWIGTARKASRDQQRQRQAGRQDALAEAELVDEQAQRQQTVDDRRHAGQVGDVDLDQVGEPVLPRILLEVHGRTDADRHRREDGHQHHERTADPGREDAGLPRTPRREAGQEIPGQPGRAVDDQIEQGGDQHQDRERGAQNADGGEDVLIAHAGGDARAHGKQFLVAHCRSLGRSGVHGQYALR